MNTLYENIQSGEVVCHQHLGFQATCAFEAKPKAKSVRTSFGTIRKMNQADTAEWMNLVGDKYHTGCEICR
jgi:hypothetical protein